MGDSDVQLIAEQVKHALDLLEAEIGALRAQQGYDRQMSAHRLEMLEGQMRDQEARLRSATDGVSQFKVWAALTAGGSGLLSLAALVKAWLGG